MKRTILFLASLLILLPLTLMADNDQRDGHEKSRDRSAPAKSANPSRAVVPQSRQPVVINMNHGTSGGHDRHFPAQEPSYSAPKAQSQQAAPQAHFQPSYGQLHWNTTVQNKPQPQVQNWTPANHQASFTRPNVSSYRAPGVQAAVAVHHHPYQEGYVRKKLQKIGVTAEPNLITNRAEMIHTDRVHSVIAYPHIGPDHGAVRGAALSPRRFNDPVVRGQMRVLDRPEWGSRIAGYNDMERERNHYYWHQDAGFNYCHYIDGSGYHWWGWYVGDQYFWTRYYASRWWWYDTDFDRWCFWNAGFWWWQDPFHVGDLYCYNNTAYVPCNSAEDQVVVTAPVDITERDFTSPDGTRMVKMLTDSQDAFLYDTANPPNFDPVYLASGVKSVQFSDISNGRPLEIILSLNDGSYDMFDSYGNAYGPGANDADQASQNN